MVNPGEKYLGVICAILAWKIPWTEEPGRLLVTCHFHAMEKEMATHSSVLAWRILGTGERGGVHGVAQSRTRLKCRLGMKK